MTQTWIAFLRAVNVGGRKVEMARLRDLLGAGPGLERVRTYIASGNVFFDSDTTSDSNPGGAEARAALTATIERRLREEFGFEVPTLLRTLDEVESSLALAAAPFGKVVVTPDVRLSVVFTSGPLVGLTPPLVSPKGDWEIVGATAGEAFVVSRLQDGRLGANPIAAIEKTYGVRATARFFHTMAKIVTAAKKP
jgi:uncharacterized protein (DUF1697 family)